MFPSWFQHMSTLVNHIVELPAPFLIFMPRTARVFGGVIQVGCHGASSPAAQRFLISAPFQIGFQILLILSGNLSFLNHLTILPAIWCLDDQFLR